MNLDNLRFTDRDGDKVDFEKLRGGTESDTDFVHVTLPLEKSHNTGTYLTKTQARELFNWLGVHLHRG